MILASCHLFQDYNLQVVLRFLENVYIPDTVDTGLDIHMS
jgi:hypothetical protein